MTLLLCDFGLQLCDGLGQRFQRVLFVEIQPALRAAEDAPPDSLPCARRLRPFTAFALQIGAALRQHVGIAAGIFDPAAVAFRHDHRGHDAIEEVAVMADQDHGALVVAEHFLQHVEGFEIEIVGRLVEHQQVGGLCQRACQHQAAALAAGQHFERRAHLFLREQEVLHVADDVLRLAADHDVIAAAAGQGLRQRRFRIEAFAMLVERRHLDVGAEPDRAGVGRRCRRSAC